MILARPGPTVAPAGIFMRPSASESSEFKSYNVRPQVFLFPDLDPSSQPHESHEGLHTDCQLLNGHDALIRLMPTYLTMRHTNRVIEIVAQCRKSPPQACNSSVSVFCNNLHHYLQRLSQESKPVLHETCIPDSVWITIEALQHRPSLS